MSQRSGLTTVIVEEQPVLALSRTARALVLERGRVAHLGASDEPAAETALLERLIGAGLADEFRLIFRPAVS